jgi:hypothetical protein
MDKKTYEYMRDRAMAFEKLEIEKDKLERMKKSVIDKGISEMKSSQWYMDIPNKARKTIEDHVVQGINERLSEIEKEMEAI